MIKILDTKTIRMLHADEVDRALPLALAFHKDSGVAEGGGIERNWVEVWSTLIETETGGIVAYEVDDELAGVICFLIGISPLDGVFQITEVMWYVQKPYRGQGMILLEAIEGLARALGCSRLFLSHLADTKAERLEKVFSRRGFRPASTNYMKEL